jgi:hypothetical protein
MLNDVVAWALYIIIIGLLVYVILYSCTLLYVLSEINWDGFCQTLFLLLVVIITLKLDFDHSKLTVGEYSATMFADAVQSILDDLEWQWRLDHCKQTCNKPSC